MAGEYILQTGEPVWMSEVGLGIGRWQSQDREILSWYDGQGNRILTPAELVAKEREEKEKLAQYLRSIGIDPTQILS